MKNKILFLLVLTINLFLAISCKKYLDKKPDDSLVTPSTTTDLQALLDDAARINLNRTPSISEASSDDYFILESFYNGTTAPNQHAYTWRSDNYNYNNDWAASYTPVYTTNLCLEQIDKIERNSQNEKEWSNVKGSALFYRSYYFLQLVWTYSKAFDENTSTSDLGIPLRTTSNFNDPSVRSSVRESYDKIISDTKESIMYLPDLPKHTFRPSKAAAYGLLARTFLSMRRYDSALKYSDLCLQLKNQLIDYNGDPADYNGAGASAPFKRFNKETVFYTEMTTLISTITTSNAKIEPTLISSYDANDWRRTAFFTNSGIYQRFKGSYTGSAINFTGIATDEMYLIRSECYARRNLPGDLNAAITDLNALLVKRWKNNGSWIPYTSSDAIVALNKILSERRKELVFRGLRWIDIKRLNREGRNIIPTRTIGAQMFSIHPNANFYALPIPADIITISGIAQNPE